MVLSVVDVYYDSVNTILKKLIHEKIGLDSNERKEIKLILNIFREIDCYRDETVCDSFHCRFAGIPDKWVKYEGHEFLCDLVYDYIDNGPDLKPPKGGDAMGGRIPGSGFSTQ